MHPAWLVLALGLVVSCSSDSGSPTPGGGGTASGGSSGSAGSAGTAGSTGSGGSSSGDACGSSCAVVAAYCTGSVEQCVSSCEQSRSMFSNCLSQYDAVSQCAATRPASDFTCNPDGVPQLNSGVCSDQLNALLACH